MIAASSPDFIERLTLSDVLRTIPVEPVDPDQEPALDACAAIRRFQPGEGRLIIKRKDLRAPEELQTRPYLSDGVTIAVVIEPHVT